MSFNDASRDSLLVGVVPCFSGAAWDLSPLSGLAGYEVVVMRLPEGAATFDDAVDVVLAAMAGAERFVLVGDSFGAIVALAAALRKPMGLVGLVLSGGFAADPVPRWKTALGGAAGWLPNWLYRTSVLRFHASQLRSRFDATAEAPQTVRDYRRLFVQNTPKASYAGRVRAIRMFDVRARLHEISVPTLILTPADDRLVGAAATRVLVEGIPKARELVLPRTGHMFRFTHPTAYSAAIGAFLSALTPHQA